jgi:hypothetical protein
MVGWHPHDIKSYQWFPPKVLGLRRVMDPMDPIPFPLRLHRKPDLVWDIIVSNLNPGFINNVWVIQKWSFATQFVVEILFDVLW